MTKTEMLGVKPELTDKDIRCSNEISVSDISDDTNDEEVDIEEKAVAGKKLGKRKSDHTKGSTKSKKPRVAPEKAREVRDKIVVELAKNFGFGMKEVPMATLASAVGYKHPRSDAILAAMKLLKDEGVATKTSKTNSCQFTEKGVKDHVKEEEAAPNAEAAMEQFWNQAVMKLENTPKASSAKARENAKAIWDLLQDGEAHAIDKVLGVTSYGMERSTGFPEILKAFNDLGFATKEGGKGNKTLQFTDKVFPFGRPGSQ